MLAVVARVDDTIAVDLTARWAAHGARLLTCNDLSTAGWRHYLGHPDSSAAVVGGETVPVRTISGVYTRLGGVTAGDLGYIAGEDREYVASEMTAFLVAWLASLPCPVLNRPTPECPAGPNWRQEKWVYIAAKLGMRVRPVHRPTYPTNDINQHAATVTVVGPHCFGAVEAQLMVGAQRLADAAGVDLLAVHFDGPEAGSAFLSADLWPDVTAPDVADAVLQYLTRGDTW